MSIEDQPPPVPNEARASWGLVIEDMQERNRVGTERYGTPLQPFNGRDNLVDAYQEALDLVVYLRNEIEERGALHQQASHWFEIAETRRRHLLDIHDCTHAASHPSS